MSPYMDKKECAAFLKTVSPSTVQQWAWKGKIPGRKHGNKWVFLREEIEAWSASKSNSKKSKDTAPPSRFQAAKQRLRSLKTQHNNADPVPTLENRTG